jgi:hypothetical protein
LSGGDGRRGAAPRIVVERVRFSVGEHIKRRSKRGSIRSRDGGAIDVGESSRADGIGEGATVE